MDETNLKECLIFLDDILIFLKNFEQHISRLEAVFSRLKQHGLKVNPSQCEFFRSLQLNKTLLVIGGSLPWQL